MPATQASDAAKSILDSRLVGIVRIADGAIAWCNDCFAAMFGYTAGQLVGRPSRVLHTDDRAHAAFAERALPVVRRGEVFRGQFRGRRQDATAGWYDVSVEALATGGDEHLCVCVDVTEERQRALEIQATRADLQAILDNVPARISAWNADLTNRFANRAAERQFGVTERGAVGRHASEVVGATRHLQSGPYVAAVLAGERRLRSAVDLQPDGSTRYSEVAYVPMRCEGRVVGFYVLGTDVTELRRSYDRIRDLAWRLETVREDERRSVAGRLHEGIAQDLYAAKLRLERLRSGGAGAAGGEEEHAALAAAIERCLDATRNLADEIWPSALAHLSLLEAIAAHAHSYSLLTGLEIGVTAAGTLPTLRDPLRYVFFRAAQEALAQLAPVAGSSRVVITLSFDGRVASMEVRHDGVGGDESVFAGDGAVGLLGVRERVTAMGGSVTATRGTGAGRRLTVSIPVDRSGDLAR